MYNTVVCFTLSLLHIYLSFSCTVDCNRDNDTTHQCAHCHILCKFYSSIWVFSFFLQSDHQATHISKSANHFHVICIFNLTIFEKMQQTFTHIQITFITIIRPPVVILNKKKNVNISYIHIFSYCYIIIIITPNVLVICIFAYCNCFKPWFHTNIQHRHITEAFLAIFLMSLS